MCYSKMEGGNENIKDQVGMANSVSDYFNSQLFGIESKFALHNNYWGTTGVAKDKIIRTAKAKLEIY